MVYNIGMSLVPVSKRASFTLIELLIVVTLLAILGAVVVVVLNPAEMMRQSRDSTRLYDLQQLNKVLSFIQVDQPALNFGSSSVVYVSIPDASSTCANLGLPTLPSGWAYACSNSFNYKKINGNGWVPVNFTQFSGGSPISKLPIDPVNSTSTGEYYTYVTGGSWKLTARLVSEKYTPKAGTDSGSDPALFEQGNDVTLAPFVGGMVGWWTFEETGTTASDSSGFANNGTMYSSSTVTDLHTSSGCKVGSKCAYFDEAGLSGDYVEVSYHSSLNVFAPPNTKWTVSLWAKPMSGGPGTYTVLNGVNHRPRLVVNTTQSALEGFVSSVFSVIAAAPNSITNNVWNHVAFLGGGTTNKIYVNGVEKASVSYKQIDQSFSSLRIGASGWASENFWGYLDDVRIYNRALSAAEVKAIYDATK